MQTQKTKYENEFEQELPEQVVEQFNTLQSYSAQPTTLLETTLADTLGLSMHNAVTSQQQSQMTTAASITNACARLLQTQTTVRLPLETVESIQEPLMPFHATNRLGSSADEVEEPVQQQKTRRFNLFKFFKRKENEEAS